MNTSPTNMSTHATNHNLTATNEPKWTCKCGQVPDLCEPKGDNTTPANTTCGI